MEMAGPWQDVNDMVANPLSPDTLDSLRKLGFPNMTPVQRAVLLNVLNFKDVAVEAVTGSGKTLAFIVPGIEFLRKAEWSPTIRVLVLVPTRPLAQQVLGVIESFAPYHSGIVPQLVTGGVGSASQNVDDLSTNHPNMIIATPGRLTEVMTIVSPSIFRDLDFLAIDEADRIFEMGQEAHLSSILSVLPKQRRTGLFSATLTDALQGLAITGMRNPVFVRILVTVPDTRHTDSPKKARDTEAPTETRPSAVPADLSNFYTVVDPNYKFVQLFHLLSTEAANSKVILFVLTGAIADYFHAALSLLFGHARSLFVLHGSMNQTDRDASLSGFRGSLGSILIATDVAARGIDIPDVDWIVQFDPPQNPKTFIHRVGRTARLEKKGNAILFLREHEVYYVPYMEKQSVVMTERSVAIPHQAEQILMNIRQWASTSEAFYRQSILAMVSYARAYGEHQLKILLRKKEVDFVALGNSLGLVRLPVMPELKNDPRACEYNERFAQFAAPYRSVGTQIVARQRRDKTKQKKRKKQQRSSEEEIVEWQRRHRKGAWVPAHPNRR
jgi:ATP-dependent RNA helicase DDX55/SPB4